MTEDLPPEVTDRADALRGKRPSPINSRNAAILAGALVIGGGYFGVKADGATVPAKSPLDLAAAQASIAPPKRNPLFSGPALPAMPVDPGPTELERQMATLMGAVESLGARIDVIATTPPVLSSDPAAEAVLAELRILAESNAAMRDSLEQKIAEAEGARRSEARARAELEMQIAELRAEMASGPAFTAPAPIMADSGEDPAAIAALAEAKHRRELERLRLEAELARAERLEEERLARDREARAHEREKELRSLEAHFAGKEAEAEAMREEREAQAEADRQAGEAAIARMDALEAQRIAALEDQRSAEQTRRTSGGIALQEDGSTLALSTPTAVPAHRRPRARQGIAPTAHEAWLETAAQEGVETIHAVNLPHPDRLIAQGTFIPGIMETAIQSDLPGGIRAVVSDPVWSADGSSILLPAGSRLIGQYRSDLAIGETRILIAWTRAITPDHRSVSLGSTGTDALGRAGQGGKVDTHFAQKFEAAFLVSIVTGLANFGTGAAETPYLNESLDNGIAAGADAANGTLEEYLSIAPTIHVNQGSPITVFVQRDLYL